MGNANEETWIFGYGSLIWRPGFEFAESKVARVNGWVRRFWQASPDHRGTPEAPGRVATLLRWPGRRCVGMAYRLHPGAEDDIMAGLDRREVEGYQRVTLPLVQSDGTAFGDAFSWVATTSNAHFIGMAAPAEMAAQIASASGGSGKNLDYVLELARTLRDIGEDAEDQTFEIERLLLARPMEPVE